MNLSWNVILFQVESNMEYIFLNLPKMFLLSVVP